MQTDLLILQDQSEVFSTGIKSEKGKGDNISKTLGSDDPSEGKDADFLSTLIGITNDQGMSQIECLALLNSRKEEAIDAESLELRLQSLELEAETSLPLQGTSGQGAELKAQSLELKVEISDLKVQGPELKSESSELKAESSKPGAESLELRPEDSGFRVQGSEVKAESSDLKVQGPELKSESSELKAESSKPGAESLELRAEDSGFRVQGSEVKAESSDLKIQGPELKFESSDLRAQGPELKSESSDLKVQGPELKSESSDLKVQGPELKSESSELKSEISEFKAQNTDTDKAARISTIFKETENSQIPDREAKAAETTLPLQGTSGQGSKLKAESSQPEAQYSTLKAQSLNSNLQEAGEVVKNLIKNQASHEVTPKIEGNFQDIKTIAKNMENFDKNFSHKEPDNVLLFPESRSSDRVSDTGLHAKETQLIQKPLQTEVLTQIVKKAAFNLKNGQTEVKIDLKPEFLGRIQLKISTDNHQVMIRMLTEIPLVKDIIENNINHLKADLQSHGLEIDKFDVFLTRDSDQHGNGHENAEFLIKNGETGEGEADGILAKEMEEEAQFAHERTGANLIGVFA